MLKLNFEHWEIKSTCLLTYIIKKFLGVFSISKERLISGSLTPLEFLENMSHSHCVSLESVYLSSSSQDSDTLEEVTYSNLCVVFFNQEIALGFSCHTGMHIVAR